MHTHVCVVVHSFMLLFFRCVACPALAKIPHVLVVHGEGDGTLDHMKVYFYSN